MVNKERGISLFGTIFVLVILALAAMVALKVVPTVTEYMTIKKAIMVAKAGSTVQEIRVSFDKQADVGYVDSISAKDLDIEKTAEGYEISFAYEKKIPLFGPVSLAIDYEGSTAPATLGPKRKSAQDQ
jgi:hypothetical protein